MRPTKAFDCVNHGILLDKLEFYGIHGTFRTLIEAYLTDRQRRVALGHTTDSDNSSGWEKVKCGIQQGSTLGPLLFLLYINDLPKTINTDNNMVLYVDDTSIIITEPNKLSYKINLNQTFKDINTWFKANLLKLNFNKTQYMEFRTTKRYDAETYISYEQKSIPSATVTKFLGLTIDDVLSWQQHINLMINRLTLHVMPYATLNT